MDISKFSVVDTIDSSITQTSLLKDYRERHLYPSSASVITNTGAVLGACARAEWFRLCDIENIEPYKIGLMTDANVSQYDLATQQYIFASGNMWESFVVSLLHQSNIKTQHHVKFKNPKFHLSGELDIIVHPNGFEKPIIIEMKTTNGYFNEKKIFKDGIPKIENLLQCAIYAHHFRNETCGVKLVYIDRGNVANRREFNILYHENEEEINGQKYKVARISVDGTLIQEWTINGIYARFKKIWDDYIDVNIPSKDYTPTFTKEQLEQKLHFGEITKSHAKKIEKKEMSGDYKCYYCPYKLLCEQIDSNEFDIAKFKEDILKHRKKYYNI